MTFKLDAPWRRRMTAGLAIAMSQAGNAASQDAAAGGEWPASGDGLGVADDAPPAALPRRVADGNVIAAFSGSRSPGDAVSTGHAVTLDRRALNLLRPGGARQPALLTLNTLALEAMRGVPSGAHLRVAIYALSPRVPEFGALLGATRRGMRLSVPLDGRIGARTTAGVQALSLREGLGIGVMTTRCRMHQKCLCCPDVAMVLTGTANMTEEASARHSDVRIR